ncbi:MAG: hypothetical protein ACXWEY_12170 [Bacteroidia bacterium]
MNKFFAFLIIVSVFFSCVSHRVNKYSQLSDELIKIDYKIDRLTIEDERANISETEIKLPFISIPGQKILNTPQLDTVHTNLILKEIHENFEGTNKGIVLTVYIEEAYKEFSTNLSSEIEKVYVKVKIKSEVNNIVYETSSMNEYIIKSGDAKKKRIEKLYQNALRNAVHDCVNKLKVELLN